MNSNGPGPSPNGHNRIKVPMEVPIIGQKQIDLSPIVEGLDDDLKQFVHATQGQSIFNCLVIQALRNIGVVDKDAIDGDLARIESDSGGALRLICALAQVIRATASPDTDF